MSTRAFIDDQTLSSNVVEIACRIALNGTSAPDAPQGQGFGVATRTAQGKYKVTLKEPWFGCVASFATLGQTIASGNRALVNTVTVRGTTPNVTFATVDDTGAYVDIATENGSIVNVTLYLYKGAPN